MKVQKKIRLKNTGLSMPIGHLNARCEFALMRGYVIDVAPQDLRYVLEYCSSAILCGLSSQEDNPKVVAQSIIDKLTRHHKTEDVRYICFNTIEDMVTCTLLINVDEDNYSVLPEDACDLVTNQNHKMGGYSYWYSFVYNYSMPMFSEFGDTFYEDAGSGFIHRVS